MKIPLLLGLFLSLFCAQTAMAETQKATFAGGCFWCMDSEFREIPGVTKVLSGYTGGQVKNPTYEQVSSGTTGHVEAIEVTYDPTKVSYAKLLDSFWGNVDPLDANGQFCDKGSQYHAGIFTHDETQKKLAEASRRKQQEKFGADIATFIHPAEIFYPAEEYHQDYAARNKAHYQLYRLGCGRDARLQHLKTK